MQFGQQAQFLNQKNINGQNLCKRDQKTFHSRTFKSSQTGSNKESKQFDYNFQCNTFLQADSIKSGQFMFRMKLKLIACMQQMQVEKQDIQNLRKQEVDTQILQSFINPVKKQFNLLKKFKDSVIIGHQSQQSPGSLKNIAYLEVISLESQLTEVLQSQKKMKAKFQKLYTQNAQLMQKIKRKQYELEEHSNDLYKAKMELQQYKAIAQNLKSSTRNCQKQFIRQKQRLNEQINGLKQLIIRQREAKQQYSSKLENVEMEQFENQGTIKRLKQQVQFLKKQSMKWKNRSEWRQNQINQQLKQNTRKNKELQSQVQRLNQTLRDKQSQSVIAKKQTMNCSQVFNKKLQHIVQEWKSKLIQTVEQYQLTIQDYADKISSFQDSSTNSKDMYQRQIEFLKQQNIFIMDKCKLHSQQNEQIKQKIIQEQKKYKKYSAQNNEKMEQLSCTIDDLRKELCQKKKGLEQGNLSNKDFQAKSKEFQMKIKGKNSQIRELMSRINEKELENIRIQQAKRQTQNELINRISTFQNNRILQISKLKLESEDKARKHQAQTIQMRKKYQRIESEKIQLQKNCYNLKCDHNVQSKPKQVQLNQFNTNGHAILGSSQSQVVNSLNADRTDNRVNRFTQDYIKPSVKSSVRRVFVRSNSINQDSKDFTSNSIIQPNPIALKTNSQAQK